MPTDEKERAKVFEKNPKLKAAVEGKELVPVKAEDIGVEAVDDYTFAGQTCISPRLFSSDFLRINFSGSFRRKRLKNTAIDWTKPENIVTSGAFKLSVWKPYDESIVVKDPNYWDAANVHLDGIEYYPMDEQTTMMNLYKAGRVDALYNHTVPAPWNDVYQTI